MESVTRQIFSSFLIDCSFIDRKKGRKIDEATTDLFSSPIPSFVSNIKWRKKEEEEHFSMMYYESIKNVFIVFLLHRPLQSRTPLFFLNVKAV